MGARPLLLAWNVVVEGIDFEGAKEIAATIRESGGGFQGLRALALPLPSRGAIQISMNLEDMGAVSPFAVFQRIEEDVMTAGGMVVETEVIGMIPDELVLPAAASRLRLAGDDTMDRLLSRRIARHLATTGGSGGAGP